MRTKFLSLLLIAFLTACSNQTEVVEEPVEEPETPVESEAERLARLQAEYDANEAIRKEELGSFYVPLPGINDNPVLETETVKALYVTFNIAGLGFNEEDVNTYADYITTVHNGGTYDESKLEAVNRLEEILGIAKATEINSLVIDIKDDRGNIGWPSDIQIVNELGSNQYVPWTDYQVLLDYLELNDIYTIARIVAFKDPYFAENNPDHAILLSNGSGVYKDKSGFSWVNPFDTTVWNYNIAVAKEAALRGFDEIQFDYVRFPDNAAYYNPITTFPGRNDQSKDDAIAAFLKAAKTALEPYKVNLAADVFGVITYSWNDQPEDIGQTWIKMAPEVDVMCPMVYPSHYGTGFYGFSVPDAHPYEVVKQALIEGLEKNAAIEKSAIIRPWLQGFTASWVKGYITYDEDAMQAQIKATYDVGLEEYIIWMSSNKYLPQTYYTESFNQYTKTDGVDILGRTPEDALRKYLDGQVKNRLSFTFLLTPLSSREADWATYIYNQDLKEIKLKSYDEVIINTDDTGQVYALVHAKYQKGEEVIEVLEAKYLITLEKDVYKISEPIIEAN